MLLERGHRIKKPHKPNCFCKELCTSRKRGESLSNARSRLHAYAALSNPVYLCQLSYDPVFSTFMLCTELEDCSKVEKEFKNEYSEMAEKLRLFSVEMIEQCRTTEEVEMILKHTTGDLYSHFLFPQLILAIDCEIKEFVTHPNCQQVLRSVWLGEWHYWKKKSFFSQLMWVIPHIIQLPFMVLLYMFMPWTKMAERMKSPINKFLSATASYVIFLILIIIQTSHSMVTRGPPSTGWEWPIMIWVLGYICVEINKFWFQGYQRYFSTLWNWYDICMLSTFVATFSVWLWAYLDLIESDQKYLERRYWKSYDPALIGEGLFAIASILAYWRLLYIFQINSYLGPLQIRLNLVFYKD
uniref:Eka-Trp5 protein n=1 Tax=Euperipatoides kanangrensis TaxID=488523 RepID=A0A0F7VHL3_9BILA|nr:Eka-Trp5 protein [Euperipatoides kanangrensis]